jgi:hypothetical protein
MSSMGWQRFFGETHLLEVAEATVRGIPEG